MGIHAKAAANQNVNLGLSSAIEISFVNTDNTVGSDVNINFGNVNKYQNGVNSGKQQLKVQSNEDFTISVHASNPYFQYTGSTIPAPQMPISDLNLKVTDNATGGNIASPFSGFADLDDMPQTIISNGQKGGNQLLSVRYKANPGFDFPEGTYSVDIIYTATQQ